MKKHEEIPTVPNCEDKTDIGVIEELNDVAVVKEKNIKKLLLSIGIIVVACISFLIGRYFYNNGEVTNRTITLNIDMRNVEGKYTGKIKDGFPDGKGKFIYSVGEKKIKSIYSGTFSKGRFLNGRGSLIDGQGNIVYQGEFINGLPDKEGFEKVRESVTGLSVSEWAIDKNLFKCYQQIGSIAQVNRWEGTENGVCLSVITGGRNYGKVVRVFFENKENMTFHEGNLLNWQGRLTYVPSGSGYPEVIAYFVETFTQAAFQQEIYDSIVDVARKSGFKVEGVDF